VGYCCIIVSLNPWFAKTDDFCRFQYCIQATRRKIETLYSSIEIFSTAVLIWDTELRKQILKIEDYYRVMNNYNYLYVFFEWKRNVFVFFNLDQLGTVSSNSLPSRYIRPCHLRRESLPRATERCWDHECMLWTSQSDGKMRSTSRQIHGLLSVVPRGRGTEGCERRYC